MEIYNDQVKGVVCRKTYWLQGKRTIQETN